MKHIFFMLFQWLNWTQSHNGIVLHVLCERSSLHRYVNNVVGSFVSTLKNLFPIELDRQSIVIIIEIVTCLSSQIESSSRCMYSWCTRSFNEFSNWSDELIVFYPANASIKSWACLHPIKTSSTFNLKKVRLASIHRFSSRNFFRFAIKFLLSASGLGLRMLFFLFVIVFDFNVLSTALTLNHVYR